MSGRAALLPTPGDPYVLTYWLRNYERVWRDEVDDLLVLVNGQPDPECRAWIRTAVERVGGQYLEGPHGIGHGGALTVLLDACDDETDIVVLVEDDGRVRRAGEIAGHVERVRSGAVDVVASPRTSMSPELHDAAARRWGGIDALADGSWGYGMWTCFLFARLGALLATARDLGARGWVSGERVPGIDHVAQTTVAADTFGATAFQLRDAFRVEHVPQYKGPWLWREQIELGHTIPWFHIGSLSSWGRLTDPTAELACNRRLDTKEEVGEWGHRLHWWLRFLRLAGDDLPEHQARYSENLDRLMAAIGVTREDAGAGDDGVDAMVTWDEG